MPNTAAAKKALRQTKKRTALNIARKRSVRELTKAALKSIDEKSPDAAKAVQAAVQALDKAAKAHTVHANNAARSKSQLQRKLNAMK